MFQIDTLILFVFGLGLPKTRVIQFVFGLGLPKTRVLQFGQWAV